MEYSIPAHRKLYALSKLCCLLSKFSAIRWRIDTSGVLHGTKGTLLLRCFDFIPIQPLLCLTHCFLWHCRRSSRDVHSSRCFGCFFVDENGCTILISSAAATTAFAEALADKLKLFFDQRQYLVKKQFDIQSELDLIQIPAVSREQQKQTEGQRSSLCLLTNGYFGNRLINISGACI